MTPKEPIIPIGSTVNFGGGLMKVEAVMWIGERYYSLIDKYGVVTLAPAYMVKPISIKL